jgi:hypothetical protein
MSLCTANGAASTLHGHQPGLFGGQKEQILKILLACRGQWVPAYELANVALQYGARIYALRRDGYAIENRTQRVGRQVRGSFRLISCPGESVPVGVRR